MKKYFAIFAAIALLGMLAIYFAPVNKKQVSATVTSQTDTTSQATVQPSTNTSNTAPSVNSTASTSTNSSGLQDGAYTGSSISTRYGTIQVAITISSGKITDVEFLKLPDEDMRSYQISNQASPLLKSQTLAAQSSNINGVSGATYTTSGYIKSLQSAIDKANS